MIYIGAAISVVASILLIVGAHYKRRSLIVPWLLYDILVLGTTIFSQLKYVLITSINELYHSIAQKYSRRSYQRNG